MAKAPYDPFRADGTWNWEAARDMTDDQLKDAWDRHKAKASKSSTQEPVDTDPVEHAAFQHWIKVESKGQHTRGTMDYWRERWLEEGRAVWLEFGKDEFLWNMSKAERADYLHFSGARAHWTVDERRKAWAGSKREPFTTGGRTTDRDFKWNFEDFYEDPWKQTGGQSGKWGWQRRQLQMIMLTQFDMIASAYGEHERKRRRMEENEYRAANPVGVIKVVSVPTLADRLQAKLEREVTAGRCTIIQKHVMLNKVYPETEVITKQADAIAKILLSPLSNFSYYAQ